MPAMYACNNRPCDRLYRQEEADEVLVGPPTAVDPTGVFMLFCPDCGSGDRDELVYENTVEREAVA